MAHTGQAATGEVGSRGASGTNETSAARGLEPVEQAEGSGLGFRV